MMLRWRATRTESVDISTSICAPLGTAVTIRSHTGHKKLSNASYSATRSGQAPLGVAASETLGQAFRQHRAKEQAPMPTTIPRSLGKAGPYPLYVTGALLGVMAWPSRGLRPGMARR